MAIDKPRRRKLHIKMATVARDSANSGRDYQIPLFQARILYDMGHLAWSPDTKTYIDDDGRTFNAIRQGKIVLPNTHLTPGVIPKGCFKC